MTALIESIYNCTARAGWTAMFLLATFSSLSQAKAIFFGNTYSTSWVGNSFNEGNTLWMPDWQRGMGVAPDGTVFVAGGSEMDGAAMLRWDAAAGKPRLLGRFGSHWDWSWCAAVHASGWYVGGEKKGLVRFPLAPPLDPDVPTPRPEVQLIEQGWISGVAVIGDEVFAMDATQGKLRVFDTKTLKEVRSWDVPRNAVHLAADDRGRLWTVVEAWKSKTAVVRSWNADGTDTGLKLEGLDEALTVAWDGFAKRLLVGTGGSTNQVLIVDVSGAKAKVVGTFGEKGGIMSEPAGRMGPGRFKKIRSLAVDAKGNRYVNCEYGWNGSNVDCYSPEGKRLWFVYNNGFCEGVVLDPQDETIAYSSRQRFKMDWSKKTPGSEATWDAITYNADTFPEEGRATRFTQPVDLLHIGGKPNLIYTFQGGSCFWANRFEGHFAVPYAFLGTISNGWGAAEGAPLGFPKENGSGAWQQLMWLDRNRDGISKGQPEEFVTGAKPANPAFYSFSADGSIWSFGAEEWNRSKLQIYKIPSEGLDEHGVPRWDFAKRISFPAPEGLGDFRTATLEEAKDRLYVHSVREGVHRLSRWDQFTHGKPTRIWESAPIPYEDAAHTPGLGYGGGMSHAIRQAGKYLFIAYGWSSVVSVWDSENGTYIGTLKPVGIPANLDGALDAEYGHSAFLRKDGEYAVFAESAGGGRVNLYRWKPHSDIVGTNGIEAMADARTPAVDLTWGTVAGVEGWRIERLGGADAEWLKIAELPAKTLMHRDNGLWAGTIYQYRIRAVKRDYVSEPSVPALVGTADPGALTGTPIGSGKATAGAFDGDLRTVAIDDEKDPRPGWVGLDFGKPVAVTRAYVLAPDDFQGDAALSDARLQVAPAPEGPWTDAGLPLGDIASGLLARRNWTEQTLSGEHRCVRLLGSKDRPLRLAELRVSAAVMPVTKLVVPHEILAVDPGQEIELAAEAAGDISRVDFVVDGRCIGSAKKAPFRLRWRVPADKGTWTVRAAAVTKRGQASWSESAIVHTRAAAILRLNCGGDKIPGWSVDAPQVSMGGGDSKTDKPIDLSQAVDPAPEAVYQSCQWDPREIRVAQLVPGRCYVVRLHLAEIFTQDQGKGPNTRRTKVLVGYDWKLNLDVSAQAGGAHRALTRSFLATADRQGTIPIAMQWLNEKGQASPCLNGIELIDPMAAEGKP